MLQDVILKIASVKCSLWTHRRPQQFQEKLELRNFQFPSPSLVPLTSEGEQDCKMGNMFSPQNVATQTCHILSFIFFGKLGIYHIPKIF